uniref:hypothetical protein n=1 Tax=Halobacteriovorax sp. TaxID=2020862 RepID=UPI0035685013
MYRIKLFTFILVTPLLMANQCSTAVKHAGIRTVSSPLLALKGIYSALTPDKYEQLVEEEKESSSDLSLEALSLSCESQELENDSATENLYLTAKTIDSKLCSACVPWARVSEPEPFCSPLCNNACEKVCPQKGLKILDRYKEKVLPRSKDKLSFRNSSQMFHDADSAMIPFQGYCSGMVSSRRKFNMNGFFEPDSKPIDESGKVISRDDPKLVDYYQEIIEDIHDNIPTEI